MEMEGREVRITELCPFGRRAGLANDFHRSSSIHDRLRRGRALGISARSGAHSNQRSVASAAVESLTLGTEVTIQANRSMTSANDVEIEIAWNEGISGDSRPAACECIKQQSLQ